MCGGGGGGLPIFLSPLFEVDHRTPLYTTDEGTPNIPFIEAHKKLSQSMYLYFLFQPTWPKFRPALQKSSNTWSYLTNRPKLAEISATSIETPNMITEMGT